MNGSPQRHQATIPRSILPATASFFSAFWVSLELFLFTGFFRRSPMRIGLTLVVPSQRAAIVPEFSVRYPTPAAGPPPLEKGISRARLQFAEPIWVRYQEASEAHSNQPDLHRSVL